MKFSQLALAILCASGCSASPVPDTAAVSEKQIYPPLVKRQGFNEGEPIDGQGNGAPFSGLCSRIWSIYPQLTCGQDATNHQIDLDNPDNLGAADSTDAGVVPNNKWPFSDSSSKLYKGGWLREQVVTDLPSSPDISAAQLHLTKGALRELHWHNIVCA